MSVGANDLTTLLSVKQYLRINATNDDGLLQTLISGCSNSIQQYLNVIFKSQDYTMVANGPGYGCQVMPFDNSPVSAVATLFISGYAIPAVAITDVRTQGFRFDADYIYLNGYEFCRGIANVIATYTSGFATVPLSIVQAANQWIGYEYREIERIGMSSKGLANEHASYIASAMPEDVAQILENWRKVIPTRGGGGL